MRGPQTFAAMCPTCASARGLSTVGSSKMRLQPFRPLATELTKCLASPSRCPRGRKFPDVLLHTRSLGIECFTVTPSKKQCRGRRRMCAFDRYGGGGGGAGHARRRNRMRTVAEAWHTCTYMARIRSAVERDPTKVSGAWVFSGTRVPVAALFENLRDGACVSEFLSWFPGVDRSQVEAVLDSEARR